MNATGTPTGAPAVTPVWTPRSLERPAAVAEEIAARNASDLYRTSCYFRDRNRYEAFCAFYAVMRVVDDRVDGLAFGGPEHADASRREEAVVEGWHRVVSACLAGTPPDGGDLRAADHPAAEPLAIAFRASVERFPAPGTLWEDFFTAMRRDLARHGFAAYEEFVDYAFGAAVAPTTLYLYLIASERDRDTGAYYPPAAFELARCGRELGLFAYLAHVLRDLREDLASGNPARRFLAADDMAAHGVTRPSLLDDLANGRASPPLRSLTEDLVTRARDAARRGRGCLEPLEGRLTADRAFVIELIVRTYEAVLDKIAACGFDTLGDAHRLTLAEKKSLVFEIAEETSARHPVVAPC